MASTSNLGHTTMGIVYQISIPSKDVQFYPCCIDPSLFHAHLLRHFPRSPFVTLCSSTWGLVLFLDTSSFYWICNPQTYLQDPINEGYRKVANRHHTVTEINDQGPGTHPINTPSVLSIDISDPTHHVFYISCPILVGECEYRMDTCCSEFGWNWSTDIIALEADIMPNTGTACGTMAYWLTENWDLVAYDPVTRKSPRPPLPLPVPRNQTVQAQLGILLTNRLAVVTVSTRFLQLFLLAGDGSRWVEPPFNFFFINQCEDTYGWNGGLSSFDHWGIIDCRELPRPLRFETSRILEVLLVIDGKLFAWGDINAVPGLYGLYPVNQNTVPGHSFEVSAPVVHAGLPI